MHGAGLRAFLAAPPGHSCASAASSLWGKKGHAAPNVALQKRLQLWDRLCVPGSFWEDIGCCFLLPAPNALLSRSLLARLHEALKQCQDLKTEKGQMDRKINQLSEENGDLSFKVGNSTAPRLASLRPPDQGQHQP